MVVLHSGILSLVVVILLVVVMELDIEETNRMLIFSVNSKGNDALRLVDDVFLLFFDRSI